MQGLSFSPVASGRVLTILTEEHRVCPHLKKKGVGKMGVQIRN